MTRIGSPTLRRGKATLGNLDKIGLTPEVRSGIVGGSALRLIGNEELQHHGPRLGGTLGGRLDLHPHAGHALARSREHALAFNLDHAGATVAVRAVVRVRLVAQVGNVGPQTLGDCPDRLAGARFDLPAVQLESDAGGRCPVAQIDLTTGKRSRFPARLGALGVGAPGGGLRRPRRSAGILGLRGAHHHRPSRGGAAIGSVSIVARHLQSPRTTPGGPCPFNYVAALVALGGGNSSGKNRITLVSGFEAAWPRPQMEASRIH